MVEGSRHLALRGRLAQWVTRKIPVVMSGKDMVWCAVRMGGIVWRLRWRECLLEDFEHVGGLEAQSGKKENSKNRVLFIEIL